MTDLRDITCPFCGLLCDDLNVNLNDGELRLSGNACAISHNGFADYLDSTPQPESTTDNGLADLEKTVAYAAEVLKEASLPLILVANTDVATARSSVRLAEQCGGVLDHVNSPAMLRNVSVLQYSGWYTGTFAEVRNRAELVVIVGDKFFDRYPRLIERVLLPPNSLLDSRLENRKFVLIGPWDERALPVEFQKRQCFIVNTELSHAANMISILRLMQNGNTPQRFNISTSFKQTLEQINNEVNQSKYTVVIWSAADFDFAHSELLVQDLVEWVRCLNNESRAVALPMSGNQGDLTLNQVCTWQCGLPIRTSFSHGYPEHDPYLFDYRRLLKSNEADAVLIIGHCKQEINLDESLRSVVVAPGSGVSYSSKQTYLPCGVPGIHHNGHMFRGDSVVSIPLRQIQYTGLPSPAEMLDKISGHLNTD